MDSSVGGDAVVDSLHGASYYGSAGNTILPINVHAPLSRGEELPLVSPLSSRSGSRPAARARGGTAGRPPRRLYHAEQVMEQRKLPKKKYLATQRLRRDLERSSVESLKLDVNYLRQEIVNLRTVRQIVQAQRLTAPVDATGSAMAIVAQYHVMMKHGVGREPPNAPLSTRDKLTYLQRLIDADVRISSAPSVRGRAAFIEQVLAYTLFHAHLVIDSPRLHELLPSTSDASNSSSDPLPVIVASSTLRVRVSRQTLATIFPRALRDEVLVQQLVGCEVAYPLETRFYFSKARTIVRHDTDLDFVAGLNDVLQSLRTVNELMHYAALDGVAIRAAVGASLIPHTTNDDAASASGSPAAAHSMSNNCNNSNNNPPRSTIPTANIVVPTMEDLAVIVPQPVASRMSIMKLLS